MLVYKTWGNNNQSIIKITLNLNTLNPRPSILRLNILNPIIPSKFGHSNSQITDQCNNNNPYKLRINLNKINK